ncbi:hypothetical protein Q5688_33805, partial [Microcoleus sp. herbarium5]
MYTLESLQSKNLKELKEIGWELNVVPEGDRRCRQNWIDALIGVQPPLLQLLEFQPPQKAKPSIEQLDPAECDKLTFIELLELCRDTDKHLADKSLGQLQNLRSKVIDCTGRPGEVSSGNKRHRAFWVREIRRELTYLVQIRSLAKAPRGLGRLEGVFWQKPTIEDFDVLFLRFSLETPPGVEVEPIVNSSPDVNETAIEIQHQALPIESKFGRIVYPRAVKPIAPADETSPGVDFT